MVDRALLGWVHVPGGGIYMHLLGKEDCLRNVEIIFPMISSSWSLEMVSKYTTMKGKHGIDMIIIVPCVRRAKQMEYTADEDDVKQVDNDEKDEDGWMYTHSSRGK